MAIWPKISLRSVSRLLDHRAGVRIDAPVCEEPNEAAYCEAVVLTDVALAKTDCCCDLTGDGEPDNAVAGLLAVLGPMFGSSLEELGAALFADVNEGRTAMALELVGLAPGGGDTSHFQLNFLYGAALQPGPDLFAGEGQVTIDQQTMDDQGNPRFVFYPSSVAAGLLSAGPGEVLLPRLPLLGDPLAQGSSGLVTRVEGTRIHATFVAREHSFELHDGELCGYITKEHLLSDINVYVENSCGCLNLSGPLILGLDTVSPTCAAVDSSGCSPEIPAEELCAVYSQSCSSLLETLAGHQATPHDFVSLMPAPAGRAATKYARVHGRPDLGHPPHDFVSLMPAPAGRAATKCARVHGRPDLGHLPQDFVSHVPAPAGRAATKCARVHGRPDLGHLPQDFVSHVPAPAGRAATNSGPWALTADSYCPATSGPMYSVAITRWSCHISLT